VPWKDDALVGLEDEIATKDNVITSKNEEIQKLKESLVYP